MDNNHDMEETQGDRDRKFFLRIFKRNSNFFLNLLIIYNNARIRGWKRSADLEASLEAVQTEVV